MEGGIGVQELYDVIPFKCETLLTRYVLSIWYIDYSGIECTIECNRNGQKVKERRHTCWMVEEGKEPQRFKALY